MAAPAPVRRAAGPGPPRRARAVGSARRANPAQPANRASAGRSAGAARSCAVRRFCSRAPSSSAPSLVGLSPSGAAIDVPVREQVVDDAAEGDAQDQRGRSRAGPIFTVEPGSRRRQRQARRGDTCGRPCRYRQGAGLAITGRHEGVPYRLRRHRALGATGRSGAKPRWSLGRDSGRHTASFVSQSVRRGRIRSGPSCRVAARSRTSGAYLRTELVATPRGPGKVRGREKVRENAKRPNLKASGGGADAATAP